MPLDSFDEGTSKYGQLCGKADHFINFAVLLTGGGSNMQCGR